MSVTRAAVLVAAAVSVGACERASTTGVEPPVDASAVAVPSALPVSPASAQPSAAVVAPLPKRSPCVAGMALVDRRFCIDRWEASVVLPKGADHSPFHPVTHLDVAARSRSGVVPQAYISAKEADAACRRSGKRLCTTAQWLDACRGRGAATRIYPYGNHRKPGACNVHRPLHPSTTVHGTRRTDAVGLNDPRLNQQPNTVARTGSFDRCLTPEGVADLHGNLLEWTRGERPLLMGGYYLEGEAHGSGCGYVTDGHGPDYHDFSTGFRCCAEPDPTALPPESAPAARPVPSAAPGQGDPSEMRGFASATGDLPRLEPPAFSSPKAACPEDMVHVSGLRCPEPVQRCLRWLPRRSAGEKIACAEFQAPSECLRARVRMDFCIDRYELTPPGYRLPLTHVNWTEAQNLCRSMDKRLCLENEWEFACEGPDALPYPYGHKRDAQRCNHDFPELKLVDEHGEFIDRRVPGESRPECRSPFGVFNMVGNVDEWTTRSGAQAPRRSVLRGGWWLIGRNRCRAATDNHSELYAGMQTGVRCCREVRRWPHGT